MADEKNKESSISSSANDDNAEVDKAKAPAPGAKAEEPDTDEDPIHGGNPPYTTRGIFTAPKFGSAGSGGLENEPGPEKD